MADLHSLTNKQLREKCLEHGLPNVPVTDSSRNILIKRLNAIMTGKPVSKTPKSKAASSPNRRKTVAATTTAVSSGEEDDVQVSTKPISNVNRRRTTQMPAVPTVAVPINKSYNQHVTPLEPRATSTRINATDPRQRRSVSLSKTGVLTTSYNVETEPLHRTYEENGEDDSQEDEVDDVDMESIPDTHSATASYTQHNYTQHNYTQSNYNQPSYGASYTTHTMPPPLEPSVPRLYPSLQGVGLQTDYYNKLDDLIASHSSTARQMNLGVTHNPATSYVPSPQPPLPTRHTIGDTNFGSGLAGSPTQNKTSSFLSSTTKRYTMGGTTKRHTARSIDDEVGASSSDDQYEAPYLSKFSRNLENLHPEPLVKRTSGYAASSSPSASVSSRYGGYSPTAPKRRRATYEHDNGLSFAQLWPSLKEKYHLNQVFLFITLFAVSVFIYVFFLQ